MTDTETLADVFITDQGFSPPIFSISVGDSIHWMNQSDETVRIEGTGSGLQTIFLPLILKTADEGQANPTVSGEVATSGDNLGSQDTTWQSGDIPPGGTFSRTFDQTGQYTYSLGNAPTQTGALIVQPTDNGNLSVAFDESGPGLSLAEGGVGLLALDRGSRTLSIDIGGPVQQAFLYWAGRDTPCPQSGGICFIPSEPYKDQILRFDSQPITGEIIGTDPRGSTNNIGYRADVTSIVQAKGIGALSFDIEDGDTTSNLDMLDGAGLLVIYTDPENSTDYQVTVFDGLDFAFRTATTEPIVFSHGATSDDRPAQLLIFVGDAVADRPDRIDITDGFGGTTSVINELASADGEQWDTLTVDITIPAGRDSTAVELFSEPIDQNPDSLLWEVAALRVSAALDLTVTIDNDSGPGSLRQAILNANAKPGTDTIDFAIPGDGPHTIQPASALPAITDPVVIDGTTQSVGTVVVDGTIAGADVDGLTISTGNSTIRGLVITGFAGSGIVVESGTGNAISGNSIFGNGKLGIDLSGDGVTPNDTGDPDVGANNLQNFPVLLSAIPDGTGTIIAGRLNSLTDTTFSLEFFSNETCDPANFGEGQTALGTSTVTTNGAGNGSFTLTFPTTVPAGQFITATLTDPNGNTSEFSQCVPVGPNNDSWPRALRLTPGSELSPAVQEQFLDKLDQSRWYKFEVEPNSQVIVTLTDLADNFDLTLYKDIAGAFNDLNSTGDLVKLSAEVAPANHSPANHSPANHSPANHSADAFAPDAFSADAFAPANHSPANHSPANHSPDTFDPNTFFADLFDPGAPLPDTFDPETFTSAQTRSLIGVSAFEGTVDERIVANTWNNSGDFYVRVRGRNGAFSLEAPFRLEVALLSETCNGVSAEGLPSTSLAATAGNYKTIILTDLTRLSDTPTQALEAFANRPEVQGVVINVGADNRVAAANAQADLNPGCPYTKNLVAEAIKAIIDSHRALNPLEYVVIVGNDDVIPFFRHPDKTDLGPEVDYVPPVSDDTASQASLRLNYVLGQDAYGSELDVSLSATTLPIPDLAVGRLVETSADIITMLEAYNQTTDGVVPTPTSALVTGYDFLQDAAEAVATELSLGIDADADTTLIADRNLSPADPAAWTADDLRQRFLNNRYDLAFLAGHFSANTALAADYSTSMITTDLLQPGVVDMTNAIIFSAGCHSGYNIVNEHGIPGVTVELDWAQAFAQKGVTLIAGTGYQYGDTDFIEYSERLYLEFSRQLRSGTGPVSVGQALVTAKQSYLASTPQIRPLHEKSLLEATIFGLPMIQVDMPGTRFTPIGDLPIVSTTTPFASDPGSTLGLRFADVNLDPIFLADHTVTLTPVDGGSTVEAFYVSGSSGVVTNLDEPTLPLETRNVTVPDMVLRGVSFRGGKYTDRLNVLPLTGVPTTEIRDVHRSFLSDVFFPVQLWDANYFDALGPGSGGPTRLMVTPAHFKSTGPDFQTGTLRQFDNMNFRLYYSNNIDTYTNDNIPALASAPAIAHVSALPGNEEVTFSVNVVGDPAAGIQEVWVTYTGTSGPFAGQWQSLDLTQSTTDSTRWEGTLPLNGTPPEDIRYMVQAVNGVGLVTLDTNRGAYYIPGADTIQLPTSLSLEDPDSSSGPYNTQAAFSATLTDENGTGLAGQLVSFVLGSKIRQAITNAAGQATVDMPLLALPGQYVVHAFFAGTAELMSSAAEKTFMFEITKQDTTISLAPQSASGPAGDDVLLTATLTDILGQPLSERTLVFVVTGSGVSYSKAVITDYIGRAPLGNIPLPPGNYVVNIYFNGTIPLSSGETVTLNDDHYNPSLAAGSLSLIPPAVVPIELSNFCGFAFSGGQGLRVDQQATIVCNVGSNGRVDFVNQSAVITGNIVSIQDTVHLDQKVRVEGNVDAGRDVQLKQGVVVSGDVTAAGPVSLESGAVVSGTIIQNTGVPPASVITPVNLSLSAGTQDIIVEQNSPLTLAPGSYGKLEVRTEATLNLSAGVYAFESIRLDRQATVNLDVSAGTILIDVVTVVNTSEEVQMLSNGSAENILFQVQGDQVILHLNGVYLGTFLAPNGSINLEQDATLTGALYGQDVQVKHRANLIGAPAVELLNDLFGP